MSRCIGSIQPVHNQQLSHNYSRRLETKCYPLLFSEMQWNVMELLNSFLIELKNKHKFTICAFQVMNILSKRAGESAVLSLLIPFFDLQKRCSYSRACMEETCLLGFILFEQDYYPVSTKFKHINRQRFIREFALFWIRCIIFRIEARKNKMLKGDEFVGNENQHMYDLNQLQRWYSHFLSSNNG